MSVWWMVVLGWALGSFPFAVLLGKVLAVGQHTSAPSPQPVDIASSDLSTPLPAALAT